MCAVCADWQVSPGARPDQCLMVCARRPGESMRAAAMSEAPSSAYGDSPKRRACAQQIFHAYKHAHTRTRARPHTRLQLRQAAAGCLSENGCTRMPARTHARTDAHVCAAVLGCCRLLGSSAWAAARETVLGSLTGVLRNLDRTVPSPDDCRAARAVALACLCGLRNALQAPPGACIASPAPGFQASVGAIAWHGRQRWAFVFY